MRLLCAALGAEPLLAGSHQMVAVQRPAAGGGGAGAGGVAARIAGGALVILRGWCPKEKHRHARRSHFMKLDISATQSQMILPGGRPRLRS